MLLKAAGVPSKGKREVNGDVWFACSSLMNSQVTVIRLHRGGVAGVFRAVSGHPGAPTSNPPPFDFLPPDHSGDWIIFISHWRRHSQESCADLCHGNSIHRTPFLFSLLVISLPSKSTISVKLLQYFMSSWIIELLFLKSCALRSEDCLYVKNNSS